MRDGTSHPFFHCLGHQTEEDKGLWIARAMKGSVYGMFCPALMKVDRALAGPTCWEDLNYHENYRLRNIVNFTVICWHSFIQNNTFKQEKSFTHFLSYSKLLVGLVCFKTMFQTEMTLKSCIPIAGYLFRVKSGWFWKIKLVFTRLKITTKNLYITDWEGLPCELEGFCPHKQVWRRRSSPFPAAGRTWLAG